MPPPARFRKNVASVLLPVFILLSVILVHDCTETSKRRGSPHPTHYSTRTTKSFRSSPPAPPDYGSYNGYSNIFDVLSFGAKADGITDDSKAFLAAWEAACRVESAVVEVPAEFRFLVNPLSFLGPCQPNIIFQIDGTIIAPVNPRVWGSGLLYWIQFKRLQGITIQGNGLIDGRGAVWWRWSDFQPSRTKPKGMPTTKPTALRFYGSYNVTVQEITIQNSAQCHLKFDSCASVHVSNITISSPGNSPHTDGIHLQNSHDVEIHHSTVGCGDDCVSIQTGCSDVRIHHINCGPGHGISIGGLGKGKAKACVSNVTVHDITIQDALNGVRIKTWQGGSGFVRGVSFSKIEVWNVRIPIMIDQFYCDGDGDSNMKMKGKCHNQTSAVAISDVTYQQIRGTYALKAVHLGCSDTMPCTNLALSDIQLRPQPCLLPKLEKPYCWNTYGESAAPTIPPVPCLHNGTPHGKPRYMQSHHNRC